MSDSEALPGLTPNLNAAWDLLDAAKEAFIKTENGFISRGRQMTQKTLEHVESLNDPAVGPARANAVAELTKELERFDAPWGPLSTSVVDLVMQFGAAYERGALAAMDIGAPARSETQYLNPDEDAMTRSLGLASQRLQELDEMGQRLEKGVERLNAHQDEMAIAAAEVAKTVQAGAEVLIARLNLLVAFLNSTDPTSANASPRSPFVTTLMKAGINEAALKAVEESAAIAFEEILKEGAKQAAIGVGLIIGIAARVHEKRRALQERREFLEQLADLYRGRGATDDMSILTANFQQDDQAILELVALIKQLTDGLKSGFDSSALK